MDKQNYAPTWGDVREAMQLLAKDTNGRVQVMMGLHTPRMAPAMLYWRVELYSFGKWPPDPPRYVRTATWPTNQHKTVPGMLLRLIHELEVACEEEERAATARMPF